MWNRDTIVIVSAFACIYSEPERRRRKENKLCSSRKIKYLFGRKEREQNSEFACRRDKCDTIICMKLCKCYFWVRGHFRRHPKEENESQTRKGRKRENKKARNAKWRNFACKMWNRDTIVIVSAFARIYSGPERQRGKENKLEPEKEKWPKRK